MKLCGFSYEITQYIFVGPTGVLAFGSHAVSFVVGSLHNHQCQTPEDCGVCRPLAFANSACIFCKRHIQTPIHLILDIPMVPDLLRQSSDLRWQTGDDVDQLLRCLAVDRSFSVNHPDQLRVSPPELTQLRRSWKHYVTTVFHAASVSLTGRVTSHAGISEVLLRKFLELTIDRLIKFWLIPLNGRDIIGLFVLHLSGNRFAGVCRVDRHNRSSNSSNFGSFGIAAFSFASSSTGNCPKHTVFLNRVVPRRMDSLRASTES